MKEVEITYNPVKMSTTIRTGDLLLMGGERDVDVFRDHVNDMFQKWVEHIPAKIIKYFNSDEEKFHITFTGRRIEYDDLVDAVEYYETKNGCKRFMLDFVERDVCDKKQLEKLFLEIKDAFKGDSKLTSKIKSIQQEFDRKPIAMTVIGSVSAGKSTFINALLGKELLPTGDDPITAKIINIIDSDKSGINMTTYDNADNKKWSKNGASLSDITDMNANEEIFKIDIEYDIPFVDNKDTTLKIVDIPGRNSGKEDGRHRKIADAAIKDKQNNDIVVFVMPIEATMTDDIYSIFSDIYEVMEAKNDKQTSDRFIFILNKCDSAKEAEYVAKIIDDLRSNLMKTGIEKPIILPVASKIADWINRSEELTSEESLNLKHSKEIFLNFSERQLNRYDTSLPLYCKNIINQELENAIKTGDVNTQMKIYTGMRAVEEMIKLYAYRYFTTIALSNIYKELSEAVKNTNAQADNTKKLAENKEAVKKAKEKIDELKKNREESGGITKKYQDKIETLNMEEMVENEITKSKTSLDTKILEVQKDIESKYPKNLSASVFPFSNPPRQIYDKFYEKIKDEMENFKGNIDAALVEHIYEKSDNIFDEFQKDIKSIDLTIDSDDEEIDLSKIIFGNLATKPSDDIDEIIAASTETKTHKEAVYRKLSVWERITSFVTLDFSNAIDGYVRTGRYKDVEEKITDRDTFFDNISSEFYAKLDNDLKNLKENILEFVEKYKSNFKKHFDKIEDNINSDTKEIEETLNDQNKLEAESKRLSAIKKRLENIDEQIKDIVQLKDVK